jgi:hypothetical protein
VGARVAVNPSGAAALVWWTSPASLGEPDFVLGRTISPAGVLAPAVTLSPPGDPADMTPGSRWPTTAMRSPPGSGATGDTGVVEAVEFSVAGAEGAERRVRSRPIFVLSPDLAGNPKGEGVNNEHGTRVWFELAARSGSP